MATDSESPVRVRAMESADWRDVHELWSQPGVIWGTLKMPYQSADEVKQRIEDAPEGMVRIVAEVEGRVVGSAGLSRGRSPRRKHSGGIGMMVHPEHWNRGVGTALMEALIDLADNWLNLVRLELTVYTDNKVAIHLYEKYGFQIEGTHQAYALRDGAFVDAHFMARLREAPSPAGPSSS